MDDRPKEELLKECQGRLIAILQNIQEGIIIADAETKIFIEANGLMLKLLGYDNDEIKKLSVLDIHRKEDLPRILDLFEKMRKKEIRSAEDVPVKKRDGSIFYADISAAEVEIGGKVFLIGFFRDITERKVTEVALRESEERLRFLVSSSPVVIYTSKVSGNYGATFISENCLSQMGYVSQEFIEKEDFWLEHLHPEDRERILKDMPLIFKKGRHSHEYRFLRKDGSYRWMLDEMNLVYDKDGKAKEIIGYWADITERKSAEEAIRDSEEKYRVLYTSSRDAIMTLEPPDWRFTSGNPETISMFRARDEAEFTSKAPWQLSPEYQPDGEQSPVKAKRMIDAAMETGSNFFEWMHKRIDGEDFPATVLLTRVKVKDRTFLQATVRDITAQKAAEEKIARLYKQIELKLADESAFRSSLVYNAAEGIAVCHAISDYPFVEFTVWNPCMVNITGYTMEEINHLGWYQKVYPDARIREAAKERMDRMRQGDNLIAEEWEITHKDGQKRTLSISTSVLPGADNITHIVALMTDVSRRKAAEEKLRESEERYRTLAETAHDMIFIIGRDDRVEYVNKFAASYLGREPSDLIGMPRSKLFPQDINKRQADALQSVLDTGEPRYTETIADFMGKRVWLGTWLVPLHRGDAIFAVLGVSRDITEQKEAEAVLKRSHDELELEVARRTAELARAKRLSDIGTLAATVAHELRNPMSVIRTAIYNVKRKTNDTTVVKHLDRIEKKVLESDQIINNLLFYSRIKMPHYEKVNVCDLLLDALAEVKVRFKEQDVTIKDKCDKVKMVVIDADPFQLKEVFSNILNNAYEAVAGKKGKIEIAGIVDKESQSVIISFKDNGVGIDPEILPRIKDPFFTTKAKGIGLGLSVCNQIIELHNGKIETESRKGKGSKFTIILPIKRAS